MDTTWIIGTWNYGGADFGGKFQYTIGPHEHPGSLLYEESDGSTTCFGELSLLDSAFEGPLTNADHDEVGKIRLWKGEDKDTLKSQFKACGSFSGDRVIVARRAEKPTVAGRSALPASIGSSSSPSGKSDPRRRVPPPSDPKPAAIQFQDPRPGSRGTVGVIAFYHPGVDEVWDTVCGAGFLGNFWDLGPGGLRLKPPKASDEGVFENAEAAFQALKFWDKAAQFKHLSGHGAFKLKRELGTAADFSYARYGSNWAGMLAVLRAKFLPKPELADALQKTGDAYLLEHNSVEGRDKVWSDNHVGNGTNWLGMQLMLLRDELHGTGGARSSWTQYVQRELGIDIVHSGRPGSQDGDDAWRATVTAAGKALANHLGATASPASCLRHGCGKPSWNGQPNEYCGRSCKAGGSAPSQAPAPAAAVPRPAPARAPAAAAPAVNAEATKCMRPGCGKPSWNLVSNEYCSRGCRSKAP